MLHLIFGLRRAWGSFPRGCELGTRYLKDCSIDFPWFFVEIIIFEGQNFEFSAKFDKTKELTKTARKSTFSEQKFKFQN